MQNQMTESQKDFLMKDKAQILNATFEQIDFPVTMSQAVGHLNGMEFPLPTKRIVVREDEQRAIAVVGTQYEFIPYGKVIMDLMEHFNSMGMRFNVRHNITQGGRKLYSEFTFPDITFKIGNDVVQMKLLVPNSYDGSKKVGFKLGGWRLICSNGLEIGKTLWNLSASHTKSIDMKDVLRKVKLATSSYSDTVIPFWNALAEAEISHQQGQDLIEKLIPDNRKKTMEREGRTNKFYEFGQSLAFNHREDVMKVWENTQDGPEEERPRNLWTLYNAFTNVTTHKIGNRSYEGAINYGEKVHTQFQTLLAANYIYS